MSSPRRPRLNSVVVRVASPKEAVSPARGHEWRSPRSPSRSQDFAEAGNPGTKLFAGGLSRRTTPHDLYMYFSQVGKVFKCRVVRDPCTGESLGYGFVTMETVEDAERCIKHLHNTVFDGRLISVEKAKRRRPRGRNPAKRWQDRDYSSSDWRRRYRSPDNKKRRVG